MKNIEIKASIADEASSLAEGVVPKVIEFIKDQWDPKHPVASFTALLIPALLDVFSLGLFGWILTFAEALGFLNIREELVKLGEQLEPTIDKAFKTGNIDENSIHQTIFSSISNAFSGSINLDGIKTSLQNIPSGMSSLLSSSSSNKDFNKLMRKAIFIKEARNIKNAGVFGNIAKKETVNFFQKGIGGMLISALSFIIGKTLKAITMLAVPATGVALVGGTPGGSAKAPENNVSQKITLKLNPNLPYSYTQHHQNNDYNVWMETFPIEDIKNELLDWIVECYPELKSKISEIQSLSSFNKIVQVITERNNKPSPLPLTVIPEPYTSRLDIVNTIVREYQTKN